MTRLLLVSQPTVGGTAVHVAALTRYAQASGYRVTLACPSSGALPRWGVEHGAVHVPVELTRGVDRAEPARIAQLRGLMSSADLVHLHSSKAGAAGRLALRTLGNSRPPSVFTPHGWSWLVGGKGAAAYRAVERILAPVTDAVVAVSDWDAEEGRRVLGKRTAITTIPNGVDISRFTVDGPVAPATRKQTVLVVGRLSRAKGQDLALRAAGLLSDVDVEFRFIGAGEEEPRLRAMASTMRLPNVSFLGEQDPAPHYRMADLVLIPSRWDACSLVLLEALSSRTPVLASSGVGAAHSFAGEVHHLADLEPATIAAAVRSLMADVGERRRGLQRGADLVRSQWSESVRMGELLRLYERVLRAPA